MEGVPNIASVGWRSSWTRRCQAVSTSARADSRLALWSFTKRYSSKVAPAWIFLCSLDTSPRPATLCVLGVLEPWWHAVLVRIWQKTPLSHYMLRARGLLSGWLLREVGGGLCSAEKHQRAQPRKRAMHMANLLGGKGWLVLPPFLNIKMF
jgi:hypothetical protein